MARPTSFPKLEDGPEFFKVFMPTFSSNTMLIPPAFVRKFINTIPRGAILKDESGRYWHVGVEKIDPKLYFTSGWEGFVSEHKLERGDLLLFKYNGNTSFEVKVYANNGCKKELIANNYDAPQKEMTEKKSGSSSRHSEDKPNSIKIGDGVQYVTPKNRCFIITIYSTRNSLYYVQIPSEVLIGIKLEQEIMLRCQTNKLWPVGILSKNDGRVIIANKWVEFRKGNNLKENDKCLFELVIGKRNTCKEMKVYITNGGGAV